jgi:hypothetical protein
MPPPENLKLFNVRVKPSLWEEVRLIGEAKRLRISEAVREALAEYVRRNRKLLEQSSEEGDPEDLR